MGLSVYMFRMNQHYNFSWLSLFYVSSASKVAAKTKIAAVNLSDIKAFEREFDSFCAKVYSMNGVNADL